MTNPTYIIRTTRGAPMLAFDSLVRAKEARDAHQPRFKHPLEIVEQRIVEKVVA